MGVAAMEGIMEVTQSTELTGLAGAGLLIGAEEPIGRVARLNGSGKATFMQRRLVVDDDQSVTSVLKRGLSYEGFAVDTAPSGPDALALARERYPDLVILDIMMPGMDGLEVLRRMRAADPQLPILMLTARDTSADQVTGL